ncbi:MAG TPA: hypothetical protein VHU91_10080 [Mycobacteriales bacterium]|jgi:hypothetical protein|nr:hypothetical protein [Mycobacteriales bacterium]
MAESEASPVSFLPATLGSASVEHARLDGQGIRRLHVFVRPYEDYPPSTPTYEPLPRVDREDIQRLATDLLGLYTVEKSDAAVAVVVPPGHYTSEDYVLDARLHLLYLAPQLQGVEFHVYAYPGNERKAREPLYAFSKNLPKIITHSLTYMSPGSPRIVQREGLSEQALRFISSDRSPADNARFWQALPVSDRDRLRAIGHPLLSRVGLPWEDRKLASLNEVETLAQYQAELLRDGSMGEIGRYLADRGMTAADLRDTIPNGLYLGGSLMAAYQTAELISKYKFLEATKARTEIVSDWLRDHRDYQPLSVEPNLRQTVIAQGDPKTSAGVQLAVAFMDSEPRWNPAARLADIEGIMHDLPTLTNTALQPRGSSDGSVTRMVLGLGGYRTYEGRSLGSTDMAHIAKTLEDPTLAGLPIAVRLAGDDVHPSAHTALDEVIANARLQGIPVEQVAPARRLGRGTLPDAVRRQLPSGQSPPRRADPPAR